MKKLPIICLLVIVLTVETAHAQQYEFAPCGTKTFTTATGITPAGTICLDIWLTGANAPQDAGCAWLDFTGSTDDIAYVSGGRCMEDGSEGCTGPWTNGAGDFINEIGGPGTIFYIVANLGGAVPDGDGDLIVGTVTLQNTGPNDGTVGIFTSVGSCWTPIYDAAVGSGEIVISQVCHCAIDAHCDDGLFCNGLETCDAPNCTCLPGTNPCLDDGLFCNGTESCNEANDQCESNNNPCLSGTQCNEATDTCDPIATSSIPTLSEWGMIIFLTIIMGLGVVTLFRRRML
jgi:hypothetical protein